MVLLVVLVFYLAGDELLICFFFFFQAEDGIRDTSVTGVQTCALPIWMYCSGSPRSRRCTSASNASSETSASPCAKTQLSGLQSRSLRIRSTSRRRILPRSEERRVGKECKSRGAAEA